MKRKQVRALLLYAALATVIMLSAFSIAIFLGEPGMGLTVSPLRPW